LGLRYPPESLIVRIFCGRRVLTCSSLQLLCVMEGRRWSLETVTHQTTYCMSADVAGKWPNRSAGFWLAASHSRQGDPMKERRDSFRDNLNPQTSCNGQMLITFCSVTRQPSTMIMHGACNGITSSQTYHSTVQHS
jgi:hypothetical protein